MSEVLLSSSHLIHEVQHTNMRVPWWYWWSPLSGSRFLLSCSKKKKIEAHTNSELARVLFRSKRNTQNRYTAEREQWGPSMIALGYFVKLPFVGPGGQEEGVSSWG